MNEEDIKLVESLIKEYKTYNDLDGIQDLSPYMKAIENLIEENKTLKNVVSEIFNSEDVTDNYIPVSLVEETIEEYTKLLTSCNRFSDVDRIKAINERILACKELLEKR